jgi:hypothetical protein
MLVAALLVIPALVIEQSNATGAWRTVATELNWTIWTAFAVELVVLVGLARDRSGWVRRHPLDVAIVVLTIPFGPAARRARVCCGSCASCASFACCA